MIGRDEPTVICITGNGYKTIEALDGKTVKPIFTSRSLKDFEQHVMPALAAAGSQVANDAAAPAR